MNRVRLRGIGTRLPPEVRECLKGRAIDLSTASKYYRRCVGSVLPRLQPVLVSKGENRYQLSEKFFGFFMQLLREVVAGHHGRSEMGGADFLARALYRAGWLFGRRQKALEPSPFLVWPETRPIPEAWKRLGELAGSGRISGTSVVLEDPGPGQKLRLPRPGQFEHPRIKLSITSSVERERLPKLGIEIEGEPVCVLMNGAYLIKDPEEREAIRKDSKRILDALMQWVYADLGIGRLSRGRPPEHLGRDAAYLHDHLDLSWAQVAERLCRKKHKHGRSCRENLRSQARQYWVNQRRSCAALPPV